MDGIRESIAFVSGNKQAAEVSRDAILFLGLWWLVSRKRGF